MALKGKIPTGKEHEPVRGLIIGGSGSGKSHLLCSAKGSYLVDCEKSTNTARFNKMLATNKIPKEEANSLVGVHSIAKDLMRDGGFHTLCVDGLSVPYHAAADQYAEIFGDTTFSRHYKSGADKELRSLMRLFVSPDFSLNTILTCHVKNEWKDQAIVGTKGDLADTVWYHSSLVIEMLDEDRNARVRKSRHDGLTKDQIIPDFSFEKLTSILGKDFLNPSAAIELASEQTIARFNQLYPKLSEATRKKVRKKYPEDLDLTEVAEDTLQAVIQAMEKELVS